MKELTLKEMRKAILEYLEDKPERFFTTGQFVTKVGTKYVYCYSIYTTGDGSCEGDYKYPIEEFYYDRVADWEY